MKILRIRILVQLIITLSLFGCGIDSTETNQTDIAEILIETTDSLLIDEEEDVLIMSDSAMRYMNAWQIGDYAEFLLGAAIAESPAEMEDLSTTWYYEEYTIKGGYAKVSGAVEGWVEYSLWRMDYGNDLIASLEANCGPACDYSFRFYKGLENGIQQITLPTIMPLSAIEEHRVKMANKINNAYELDYPNDNQLYFNFPNKGTAMTVDIIMGADELQIPLLKLSWNGLKFEILEKYENISGDF